MPLPMVHIKVATQILPLEKYGLQRNSFYLGNIAPDAIHTREGWTREDKKKSHLSVTKCDNPSNDLARHYISLMKLKNDLEWQSFIKGYFAHLLTDYFWYKQVNLPFFQHDELIAKNRDERAKLYYLETDQIDCDLFNKETWSSSIWNALETIPGFTVPDLVSNEEVEKWAKGVAARLRDEAFEPKITPRYITHERVEAFIDTLIPQLQFILAKWDEQLR